MTIHAEKIKQLRELKGLSQEKLSEQSGLSLRTVQRIENQETVPRGDSMKRIAEVLGVPMNQLRNTHDEPEIKPSASGRVKSLLTKYFYVPLIAAFVPFFLFFFKKNTLAKELLICSLALPLSVNANVPVPADYDGDGIEEVAIWRPENGYWYISTANKPWNSKGDECIISQFGTKGDIPVPGDYNGDGKDEMAVWRPSEGVWYISLDNQSFNSDAQNYRAIHLGQWGDIPVPGDYDGDGQIEIAVWRPYLGNWIISMDNHPFSEDDNTIETIQWGGEKDIPVPGDYNGDGKTNIATYRPGSIGSWYISLDNSSSSAENKEFWTIQWGTNNDIPRPIDTNGDGKLEVAIWRPSTGEWHISLNNESYTGDEDKNRKVIQWGANGDLPLPIDFDGDKKQEVSVYRPSVGHFYVSEKNKSWTNRLKSSVDIQW